MGGTAQPTVGAAGPFPRAEPLVLGGGALWLAGYTNRLESQGPYTPTAGAHGFPILKHIFRLERTVGRMRRCDRSCAGKL